MSKRGRRFYVILIYFMFFTANAFSVVLHVPDDYASLRAAIAAASSGDEILVSEGFYQGVNNHSLTIDKNLRIHSSGRPEDCILDAEKQGRFFTISEGVSVWIEGFTMMRGLWAYTYYVNGGAISSSGELSVDRCIFIDNGIISDSEDDEIPGGAICGQASISNSVFYKNYVISDGYACGGAIAYCTLAVNCSFFRNTVNGAYENYGAAIYNCESNINCIIHDNTPGDQVYGSPMDSCYSADPAFVSEDPFDYHLRSTSLCIDAGRIYDNDHDIDRDARPQFGLFDIGADEYSSETTPTPTLSPTPEPTVSPTPPTEIIYDLILIDSSLDAGDLFDLSIHRTIPGQGLIVDEYILLDIHGLYFFWPAWTQEMTADYQKSLPFGDSMETIMSFEWPEVSGVMNQLYFYSAIFHAGSYNLLAFDMQEWEYR